MILPTNALCCLAPPGLLLAPLLVRSSVHPQYDNRADDLTKDGMLKGIESSAAFVLFLSTGVLERPYCQMEIRHALALKKPMVLLHGEMRTRCAHTSPWSCTGAVCLTGACPLFLSIPLPLLLLLLTRLLLLLCLGRERRAVRGLRLPRRARGGAR